MKVPTLQSNRVAESQGQLAYSQVPSNLGQGWNALAGGLRSLGGALTQFEGQIKERDEKTNRFNALTALNDFESETNLQQTELKRNADPSGKDFAKTASELYDKRAEDFLGSKIPQDLREEFRYRLSENRQRTLNDAYDFQYKAGDAWFRKGIDEQLNKARTAISADPASLPEWQTKMDEVIAATDLSEIEKADLREKVHISMVGTEYYETVKKATLDAQDAGVPNFDNDLDAAKALIRKEENFAPGTYWDVNAHRAGYGSDTITRDGKHIPVKKGDKITREEAEADLEYRLQEREGAAVRKQLGDKWNGLPNNVKAALYSVGYNYGSLPSNVAKAARSGDMEALAAEVEGLGANKTRRSREAAIIRGSRSIDLSEKYAAIPFDDRVKIRDAAEREAKSEYTDQLKLLNAQQKEQRDTLYTGLYDGTKNELDIAAARETGLLSSYDQIAKADKILKKRTEEIDLSTGFTEKFLKGNTPYDPTDKDNKKMYNSYIGPQGLNKLASADKDYFSNTVMPAFEQVGAMAPDVAGLLQGMMRSGTSKYRLFALDALSQLQDANPTAFSAQVPDALEKQVDYWDARKGLVPDQEDLLRNLDGGQTQEERQRRLALRQEAEAIITKREDGVPKIDEVMKDVLGTFDQAWFSDPEFSGNPERKAAMYDEFKTLFVDSYELYGTPEEAQAAAVKTMKKTWGVAPVGAGVVMKYGPDKVGYRPGPDGSYSWIDNQLRTEFKLGTDSTYELVSDDTTRQEMELFNQGKIDHPPSYMVMTQDANGVWRALGDDGAADRIYFKKPPELMQQEANELDVRNEVYNMQSRIAEITQMKMALDRAKPGEELPKELLDEEKDLNEKIQVLQKPAEAPESDPSVDAMGNPTGW